MENQMTFITKEDLLSQLLLEIEQLFSDVDIHEGDNSAKNLFVPSMSPQYPSYMIDIGMNRPEWMLGNAPKNYVVVSVLFFDDCKSMKGRTCAVDTNECSAQNKILQDSISILIDEVFDESGGYDVSLYPTELEARNTLREIMDVGDRDDAEEVEDTPLDKEEIASLVDDLFETAMEEQ